MSTEPTCPGRGQCHGSMTWCPDCGDEAAHVCPHREAGCAVHPSSAALLADLQEFEGLVWVAESDHAAMQMQVNALRKQLLPLEAELRRREGDLHRAIGERDAAKERVDGFRRYNR